MIEVKNFSVFHGTKTLVDNLNFTLKQGEKVVLLGQSGSGKTLTSLALMHLLPKNLTCSGTILYDGKEFSENMRGTFLGMIMQSPANCFDQAFTLSHIFRDSFHTHFPHRKFPPEFFESIIEKVGLKNPRDILNSYPFQLSGGMLQRIMIGLSLALETKFVIADEPSSDIDCLAEKEILSLLKKVEEKNQTLFLITHSIQTACQIAERILVMHQGKIIDDFPIQALHDENRHVVLKQLLSANRNIGSNDWGVEFHG